MPLRNVVALLRSAQAELQAANLQCEIPQAVIEPHLFSARTHGLEASLLDFNKFGFHLQ
jgi:hypothetical protein